ncbi:MAG: carboxypeptidase regulatory-like domain-containing protein [Acidobacteria bacterium]|nr:MAG: carboxypeptidase regulatory-like domain-containing protein [Acidobacteriota bacterium]REK03964.1 MAG: carboxypeptidase regulatory-like domain-containing protein [Acidobacteriota bacterium]REK15126.1 MAG: carboxypeptidase regulatory-like domain-containing protein [Acidobacteriota bacterium]REK46216.1 MAG: carboxypeptidase regulatory-like domain-containing protein [Acidobacteriota bacterium]
MSFRNLRPRMFLVLMAVFACAILVGSVSAQSGTSRINGNVTDQTGAAVPGATVTISNPNTGFRRTVTTDNGGNYSFPGIPPSTYRLEVEAANFKRSVANNVQALVDNATRFDFQLEPGEVTAVVDVTANTIESVVNTQDATIGNNFVPEQITQLPTDLRRVNDLLALQPGVTRDGYVAGGRSDQANITLDGVDINDQQTGGRTTQFDITQDSALRLTTEAVEEFRITTVNANANQGRSSGAQLSLITRRGSNDFHGAAFYFIRPTRFSANSFFNNLSGLERPSLNRDVYGGRIGGPILKDRLFFFYSYEGQQQELSQSVVRTVPLAHMGNGEMRFFGTGPTCDSSGLCVLNTATFNNVYNEVMQNPAAVAVFADVTSRYSANDDTVGDGINTGGFRFNSPRTEKENTHIARLDLTISEGQELFVRGNYQWDNSTGVSAFPDSPTTAFWSHPIGLAIGHTWTISNNAINNFRLGYTRQAFSNQGDSSDPNISFRFVYAPRLYTRTLSRVTPVTNIIDDFTYIVDDHTLQMGTNLRIIRNQRSDLGNAFDSAVTNPSFYNLSGAVITNAITDAGYTIDGGSVASAQAAATALIGRYSQYSGNFTFDIDGSVLPAGTPANRNFATEEYDFYFQDIYRPFPNLTITGGLRYAYSRPVYEKEGFQVVPDTPLGDIFDQRVSSARVGVPANPLINFVLGGPANNGPGFYEPDRNNWQPRVAVAWSPDFEDGFLHSLFGDQGDSTIRGGFSITNDYFGGQLAVSFDGLSSIGFTSSTTIAANTYDITGCGASVTGGGVPPCAPLFTGFGQDVRALPGIPAPMQRFSTPADEAQRIEVSLDATIETPTHYQWNVSFGRSLPKGAYFEASYIGRAARNLFATRDVLALNNLVDPASGMDWYTAAGMLHDLRLADTPNANIPAIPFFENLFPGAVGLFGAPGNTATQGVYNLVSRVDGFDILDWTFVQLLIDDVGIFPNMFFHPQYAAFSSFGTTAYSDYHGGSFSLRQRLGNTLSYDVNYTFSKSLDNASGLQTGASYGSQFILNPIRPDDNYALSDFDTKHVVNANFIFELPVGRNRTWFSDANSVVDAFIGGWQLAGVYRWNSGQPISTPFDQAQWATNWNVQSNTTRIRDVDFTVIRDTRNVFADPQAAFNSFRNARPGETGERNAFRLPGFQTLDLGLTKNFTMPWNENHKFQFRWEVFNVTNTQYFDAGNITRASYGLPQDPETGTASSNFGRLYDDIQGAPRSMQFGFRYEF